MQLPIHLEANGYPAASLLKKLRCRDTISVDEERIVEAMLEGQSVIDVRVDFIREGDRPVASTLLVEGYAARYRMVESGARQITAIHVPGDFVDFHSFLMKEMDHGVATLTPCRVARVPHATLKSISETQSHLMRMFNLMALIDGAIHREWLVCMGRLPAPAHAAHLFCEIYMLLQAVGLARDFAFSFPVTQDNLADMLGLSPVHVNRTLQELRRKDLIEWQGEVLRFPDWDRIAQFAEFDDTYLHLRNEPR
ncbi:MAG: Crp/Fnr family transcriptional regulator [Devosia sp.]|nr:Crp/Fnr family transcriptional regulator [Devosia sp.]